jgi:putative colanic acid biosynthesis acetyltransferase WcaF
VTAGGPRSQADVRPERRTQTPVDDLRPIAALDLARYDAPVIPGNRGLAWRAAWYLTNALVFRGSLLGLLPSGTKAALLRAFGARVGAGLVCKPRVSIKYPWFLELGDHVWIGEQVWIDNHCAVRIGSNCCISQGCYIGTGNHDWNDPGFRFFCREIEVGDGAWLTAFTRLAAGARIPDHHAVTSRKGAMRL